MTDVVPDVPRVWFGSDYDGDMYMISEEAEADAALWVVEVEDADGRRWNPTMYDYFTSYCDPLKAWQRAWFTGRDFKIVRVTRPGGLPVEVTSG